jgi:hypothetical protein
LKAGTRTNICKSTFFLTKGGNNPVSFEGLPKCGISIKGNIIQPGMGYTPVIPVIQEVKTGRAQVLSQPGPVLK